VEGDEHLASPQRRADRLEESVDVGPGPEGERLRPGRVGRVEVPAPRFDRRELVEVVEGELHRAIPTGGDADDRAPRARADRAKARVDDPRQLRRDRSRPVVPGTLIDVLGVALAGPRTLRNDEDRLTMQGVERPLDEPERRV